MICKHCVDVCFRNIDGYLISQTAFVNYIPTMGD